MPLRPTIPALALAALAVAALPGHGEITSENHAVLKRALTENPGADKDANGSLSLEEYKVLQPTRQKQTKKEEPAPLLPVLPNGEVIVADFEDNNYRNRNGWKAIGIAFQRDLNTSTRMMKRRVGPYHGKYLLTTVTSSDVDTGQLESSPFKLELDYFVVTMSGGNFPQRVCVNLWVDDELVRTATGTNDDYFEEVAFDVREYRDRIAKVEVRDDHRGLWGHLNLDRMILKSEAGDARVIRGRPGQIVSPDGVAVTTNIRRQGTLKVENGQLTIGNNALTDEVILTINPRQPLADVLPGAVHLVDGEIWQAEVRNIEGKLLSIRSKFFGERKVPLARLASVEFIAGEPDDPREPGHLYRSDGEPIPGKLVWVRNKDIAIRCPLGVIPIPRPVVQRFVLVEPTPPPERNTCEIGLMDGTLIFGKSRFEGSQLVVAHEILGELKLDWSSVRYLRRNLAGLTWLDTLKRTVVESIGPALPPPPPQLLDSTSDHHLRSLRIMPHTVVRMRLPSGPHTGATFRAQLATVPGCRADLKVSILAGSATVWKQTLPAGSNPIPLSVNLSNAEELTIVVAFSGPLAFPCGIDLRDAHILTISNLGTEPLPKQPN